MKSRGIFIYCSFPHFLLSISFLPSRGLAHSLPWLHTPNLCWFWVNLSMLRNTWQSPLIRSALLVWRTRTSMLFSAGFFLTLPSFHTYCFIGNNKLWAVSCADFVVSCLSLVFPSPRLCVWIFLPPSFLLVNSYLAICYFLQKSYFNTFLSTNSPFIINLDVSLLCHYSPLSMYLS